MECRIIITDDEGVPNRIHINTTVGGYGEYQAAFIGFLDGQHTVIWVTLSKHCAADQKM